MPLASERPFVVATGRGRPVPESVVAPQLEELVAVVAELRKGLKAERRGRLELKTDLEVRRTPAEL